MLAEPVAADPARVVGVSIGQIAATSDKLMTLAIHGLGSCIGVSLWDPRARAGAMAHFMLPAGTADHLPAKFIAAGLPRLVDAFTGAGGSMRHAQIKAAGGSAVLTLAAGGTEIGRRNIVALRAALASLGLQLSAEDLGGTHARTLGLSIATGELTVRSASDRRVL
jgi:chemotaxis protein CheD